MNFLERAHHAAVSFFHPFNTPHLHSKCELRSLIAAEVRESKSKRNLRSKRKMADALTDSAAISAPRELLRSSTEIYKPASVSTSSSTTFMARVQL
jgi:hypothetical protein